MFSWFHATVGKPGFVEFPRSLSVTGEPKQNQARSLVDRKLVQAPPPSNFIAVPRWPFCVGSLVILDVACCYGCGCLWLFSLYKNIKKVKIVVKF